MTIEELRALLQECLRYIDPTCEHAARVLVKKLYAALSSDFVCVPREPTEMMSQCGMAGIHNNCITLDHPNTVTNVMANECYKAMIEAAGKSTQPEIK